MNSIAIYSDLICPWCYIGKRRMEAALRQLPADTQVTAAGKSVGIEFRYDLQAHTPNTFDAHRLVWLAGTSGMQDAVVEAFFRAYFCEGVNFADPQKLIEVGASADMDAAELKRFFANEEAASAVREEEQRARMLGISGVPLYVNNEAVSFSGAQPVETFLEALRTAPAKNSAGDNPDDAAQACGTDGCEVQR